MKRSFRQNCLAGDKRFSHPFGNIESPTVVSVSLVTERNDETCICDSFHVREKPLREDIFGGPVNFPAWRRNGWLPGASMARSMCCRIMRPTGTPVRADSCLSQVITGSVRRIVNV